MLDCINLQKIDELEWHRVAGVWRKLNGQLPIPFRGDKQQATKNNGK